jgi:hypothetical protein
MNFIKSLAEIAHGTTLVKQDVNSNAFGILRITKKAVQT